MEQQKEMSSQVRSLIFGLDTLVANILPTDEEGNILQAPLPMELQEDLNSYKAQAQQEEEKIPTRWVFAGSNLFMLDKAGAPFKWILEHPKIKVSISRGLRAPLWGEVRFSSEYLWEHRDNYERAVSDVWLFLNTIFGEHIYLQASGVDIAKDIEGWDIGAVGLQALQERFITRAASDDVLPAGFDEDGMIDGPDRIKRRWRRITGLPFGKRNAAVSATIYDKTHEIRYQSPEKAWFYDLWPVEIDEATKRPVRPVWRIEARFKRKALHEGDIESIWDVLKRLPDLWAYAVGRVGGGDDGLPDGWLRYVDPSEDTNRARWPVNSAWEVVQAPFAPVVENIDAPGALVAAPPLALTPFIRKRKYEVNVGRAVAAFAGYASTTEAYRLIEYEKLGIQRDIEPDIENTFDFIKNEVQVYLEEKSKRKKNADFVSQVRKKEAVYHLAAVAVA
jgi:hypothetical protein